MVEAGGIEPKSADSRELSNRGQQPATCGPNPSNRGRAPRLTSFADGNLGTELGHRSATCGQTLAPKWPQSDYAELMTVIEAWPRLSVEMRTTILELVEETRG